MIDRNPISWPASSREILEIITGWEKVSLSLLCNICLEMASPYSSAERRESADRQCCDSKLQPGSTTFVIGRDEFNQER